jgi:hypothetical protein
MNDSAPTPPRTTPPIYAEQVVTSTPPTPAKNTLGLVAFIFSLTGISVLPGLGSIVGLITGVIAVRREPRGFAIAGIVISSLTGCLGLIILLPMALLLPALAKARSTAQQVMNQSSATQVQQAIADYQTRNGQFPEDLEECFGEEVIPVDAYGNELRMKLVVTTDESTDHSMTTSTTDSKIQIWSAGVDGVWDTEDDELLIDGESTSKTTRTAPTETQAPTENP